jgi:hypothetical protein
MKKSLVKINISCILKDFYDGGSEYDRSSPAALTFVLSLLTDTAIADAAALLETAICATRVERRFSRCIGA